MSAALIPSFIDYATRQGDAGIELLEKWHDQAVEDIADGGGVALTSLSYPGATHGGEVQIPSDQLLKALLAAIQGLRGQRPEPMGSHVDFRNLAGGYRT